MQNTRPKEPGRKRTNVNALAISGFWPTWPSVRPLSGALALVTVPTAPLGSRTCTYRRGTIYFNPRGLTVAT
eukprot:scaffold14422_cov67-Phaeocystis_antarctica.AAC.3